MYLSKTLQGVVILFSLLLFTLGCKEDDSHEGIIPNVPVNFTLQPDGIDFISISGHRYYDYEGYRGVVIYRIDQMNFQAYERCCPYDPEEDCARVEVDASGIILIDSCCMSSYNILDGMPLSGPSNIPLKQYFADFDGTTLHVYNSL